MPVTLLKGPLKLGDPNYRGLSKMETDPMITQRMRDISRTLCTKYGDLLNECGMKHGLMVWYHCQAERDAVVKCMEGWQLDPEFKEAVTEVRKCRMTSSAENDIFVVCAGVLERAVALSANGHQDEALHSRGLHQARL